jgi:hypothetical protein
MIHQLQDVFAFKEFRANKPKDAGTYSQNGWSWVQSNPALKWTIEPFKVESKVGLLEGRASN